MLCVPKSNEMTTRLTLLWSWRVLHYCREEREHRFSAAAWLCSWKCSGDWRIWDCLFWNSEARQQSSKLLEFMNSVICCTVCVWKHFGITVFVHILPSLVWHRWLGDRKRIQPLVSWMLVCQWWWFHWSFSRFISPVVNTVSIILSSNKIQNGDVLLPANLNPPVNMVIKMKRKNCFTC